MHDLWIKEKLFSVTHPVQGAGYQPVMYYLQIIIYTICYLLIRLGAPPHARAGSCFIFLPHFSLFMHVIYDLLMVYPFLTSSLFVSFLPVFNITLCYFMYIGLNWRVLSALIAHMF